jgi:hypothetical protein
MRFVRGVCRNEVNARETLDYSSRLFVTGFHTRTVCSFKSHPQCSCVMNSPMEISISARLQFGTITLIESL